MVSTKTPKKAENLHISYEQPIVNVRKSLLALIREKQNKNRFQVGASVNISNLPNPFQKGISASLDQYTFSVSNRKIKTINIHILIKGLLKRPC